VQAAIVRGSPYFRQPSRAAWAAGSACRLPLSATATVFVRLAWLRAPQGPGPQALAPSAGAGERARAQSFLGATGVPRGCYSGTDGRRPGGRTEMPLEEQKVFFQLWRG